MNSFRELKIKTLFTKIKAMLQCILNRRLKMFSSFFVIFTFMLIGSQTKVVRSEGYCYTNFDLRFGNDDVDQMNRSSLVLKKAHSHDLIYNEVAHAFITTAYMPLKLSRAECRDEICKMAKYGAPLSGNDIHDIAYTALHNIPYGLRLLLCSDVIIRNIAFNEEIFADAKHGYKIESAQIQSDEFGLYRWRFEIVDGDMNVLEFRIRNAKTNQYLVADRKRTLFGESVRRAVLTDSTKSDVWQLKMIPELNGDFRKFMIVNVPLGEYLYASRGFCFDKNINNCASRPLFAWEYDTMKEAEDDVHNKFIIDEYTFDSTP